MRSISRKSGQKCGRHKSRSIQPVSGYGTFSTPTPTPTPTPTCPRPCIPSHMKEENGRVIYSPERSAKVIGADSTINLSTDFNFMITPSLNWMRESITIPININGITTLGRVPFYAYTENNIVPQDPRSEAQFWLDTGCRLQSVPNCDHCWWDPNDVLWFSDPEWINKLPPYAELFPYLKDNHIGQCNRLSQSQSAGIQLK